MALKPLIVIQLGHCYRRVGATGTPGEQPFAAEAGTQAAVLLRTSGRYRVRSILADDPDTPDTYGGDAFVAIHCDGSVHSSGRGASVGYQGIKGADLAEYWAHAYARHGWTGGWRPDNYTAALKGYYGVSRARRHGNVRAFVVECGFLTNPGNKALLTGPGGHRRFGLALLDALNLTFVTAPTTPAPPVTEIPEGTDDMPLLIRKAGGASYLMINGKAVAVDDGDDFRSLVDGGVPHASEPLSDGLWNALLKDVPKVKQVPGT